MDRFIRAFVVVALVAGVVGIGTSGFAVAPAGCGGRTSLTQVTQTTPVVIPADPTVTKSSTIEVSGVGDWLLDVDVMTELRHENVVELTVTLTSPQGTIVTLTSANGGNTRNVFDGTLWDDDADPSGALPYSSNDGLVTDTVYANNVTETPLVPEEALGAFVGEDPNGTWTLTVADSLFGVVDGSLDSWRLDVTALNSASLPPTTTLTASNPTDVALADPGEVTSQVVVGAGGVYLTDVDVEVMIAHNAPDDLDVTVTSPAGTIVTLTTDNGSEAGSGTFPTPVPNAFNGTTFDDDADPGNGGGAGNLVTDTDYFAPGVRPLLTPEEALAAFHGEDATGAWTLTVSDDDAVAAGTLDTWGIQLTAFTTAPTVPPAVSFNQPAPVAVPASPEPVSSTVVVTGAGPYLLDADAITDITHTGPGDLLVVLTSPQGTSVTLTSRNGGDADDVFAGTRWDDQADPDGTPPQPFPPGGNDGLVSDTNYVAGVVATPLVPEEALGALIGENPNGTWTLSIVDSNIFGAGQLNSWGLDLTTLPLAPSTTATTVADPTVVPVGPAAMATLTLDVTGAAPYLLDLDAVIGLASFSPGFVQMALISPQGTVVSLATNPPNVQLVYDGTRWDDDADPDGALPYVPGEADGLVGDSDYDSRVTEPTLVPEEALAAFTGEDPNGTWTLVVSNFVGPFPINGWSLALDASTCVLSGGGLTGADLGVDLEADPPAVGVGETTAVTASVVNAGPAANTSATLTVELPDGATVGALPGGCTGEGTITCLLADLGVGVAVERTFDVAFSAPGDYEITASVAGTRPDPDPADNTATVTVEVAEAGGVVDDLIQAAIDASQHRFPTGGFAGAGPAFAVVARVDLFADALGGSVLLGGAPLLFTPGDVLDPRTAEELDRLAPATVYLLGGEAAVAPAVEAALDGFAVQRLAGPSRVETAIAVANEAIALGIADGSRVALARAFGTDADPTQAWADSISGGGYAARAGVPILLTPSEAVHDAVAAFLTEQATATTVLLGGAAALTEAVEAALPGAQRVAGADRFATAVAVARDLLGVEPEGERGYHLIDGGAVDGWGYGLIAAGLVADSGDRLLLAAATTPPETLAEVTGCGEQVTLTPVGPVPGDVLAELEAADDAACGA